MLDNDVFYNRQRSNFEEIQSYQPRYYRGIREMVAINKFGGYTLDRMATDMEQVMKNQFISSADAETLLDMSEFIHLVGYENSSIEELRKVLGAVWIGNTKFNKTSIKAMVMTYCGCDSVVVFTHSLTVTAVLADEDTNIFIGDLLFLFNRKIPTHISWQVILDSRAHDIKIEKSICYWLYDYVKCGTNPDVSTLGAAIETDYQVDAEVNDYLYEYDDTGNIVSGTTPKVSIFGSLVYSSVDVKASIEADSYEYEKSGENECGTTPTVATIGYADESSISMKSTADTYKYDVQETGSKICGEEDN